MIRHRLGIRLPALVVLLGASSALAQPVYQPLTIGSEWSYLGPKLEQQIISIPGTQVVVGETTVIRRAEIVDDQVYENYWTTETSGGLYLHGAQNFTHSFIVAYQPPILWLDAPLAFDDTWSSKTRAYSDLEGTTPSGDGEPFTITLIVDFAGDVTVPAGTFAAFGVSQDAPPVLVARGSGSTFDLLGRRVSEGPGPAAESTEYFSEGVGLIKCAINGFLENGYFELASWDVGTPVATRSWATIKAHYRR